LHVNKAGSGDENEVDGKGARVEEVDERRLCKVEAVGEKEAEKCKGRQ